MASRVSGNIAAHDSGCAETEEIPEGSKAEVLDPRGYEPSVEGFRSFIYVDRIAKPLSFHRRRARILLR